MFIAQTLARAKNKGWLDISSDSSIAESLLDSENRDLSSTCGSTACDREMGIMGSYTAIYQPVKAQPNSDCLSHDLDDPDIEEIDNLFADLLRSSLDTSLNVNCTEPCFDEGDVDETANLHPPDRNPRNAPSFTVQSSACLDSCQPELKANTVAQQSYFCE